MENKDLKEITQSLDEKDRIDFISKVYNDIQNIITFADSKANMTITIQSLLISFGLGFPVLMGTIPSLAKSNEIILNFIFFGIIGLFIACALSGVILSIMVYKARTPNIKPKKTQNGFLFFGHIAQYPSPEDYFAKIKSINEQEVLEEFSQQVYILSHIAKRKMQNVSWSIYCLIVSLALIVVLLALTGYISLISSI
ncbi:MAG: Pycsar system effector family protein [Promethearchaeota archaeon]